MSQKMIVKVQIMSTAIEVREGEKEGKSWKIVEQEGWVSLPSAPFPQRATFRLSSENAAYPQGDYGIDLAQCLQMDRFNSLSIDDRKIKLQPLQSVASPAPQAKVS